MEVALFFDCFMGRGGAERYAISLAKYLDADIYTSFVDWSKVDAELKMVTVNEIGLFFKDSKLLTRAEIASRFLRLKVPSYDAYIFYGFHCLSAVSHHPNIWFPPAVLGYIYNDAEHDFVSRYLGAWQRPLFETWCSLYRILDQKWSKRLDRIVANSKYTQENIKKYYGRDSWIVYEGIETGRFYCKSYEDFFLVSSRLVKEKRIDLIVMAFKEMPNRSLIIAGDGPERKNLEDLAAGSDSIRFVGSLGYVDLIDLYSRCTATIGMSISDSFPLVPLESMASGKPSIGVNATGYKESILPGKTGFLIEPTEEEIKRCVKLLTPESAKAMKKACIERARVFDVSVCIEKLREEIIDLVLSHSN